MITVGFSTRRGNILSFMIRFLTKSKVSHAWVAFKEPLLGHVVLESTWGGFRPVSYESFLKHNNVVGEFDPKWDLSLGVRAAREWLGSAYDTPGLLGNIFVIIGRWVKRKWMNPFRNAKSQFCSEAVVRILQASSFPGVDNLDPESTFPQDLYELFATGRESTR